MSEHAVRQALTRMHMREVAIARPYVDAMISDLQLAASTSREVQDKAFAERRGEICAVYGYQDAVQSKPFPFANGIAIIPVTGTLINRFGSSYSWLTGYNFIVQMAKMAAADADVRGIVLDVNSYGGEGAGCFECAQAIYNLRGTKPIVALIDSNSYSAGYAVASAADRIYCIPSGGAGSIGVLCMHIDFSKMLDEVGIKVTFIYSGEHKVDGNPYTPLPDDVQATYQKRVDASRQRFAALVAQNRGLSVEAVLATEAACYPAADALSLGLIDAMATPEEAMSAFLEDGTLAPLGSSDDDEPEPESPDPDETPDDESATAQQQESNMTDATNKPGDTTGTTQQQTAASQPTAAEARASERQRMSGILGCEEAKGRTQLANHIAMNTEMSLEDAKLMLSAAPKEVAAAAPTPAPAVNGFQNAMDATAGTGVKSDAALVTGAGSGGTGGQQMSSDDLAAAIIRDQHTATGRSDLRLVSNGK